MKLTQLFRHLIRNKDIINNSNKELQEKVMANRGPLTATDVLLVNRSDVTSKVTKELITARADDMSTDDVSVYVTPGILNGYLGVTPDGGGSSINLDVTYLKSALSDGNIFVGNGSDVATGVAMSGDATIANTGAITIKDNVTLGGSPTTTTQVDGTADTTIATTAFVSSSVSANNQLATAHILVGGDDGVAAPQAMTGDVTINSDGLSSIKLSVNLGGFPTAPTRGSGDSSRSIATTAFVKSVFSSADYLDKSSTAGPQTLLSPETITFTGPITLSAKGTSAATISTDVSSTLTTKGYVDGLVAAAPALADGSIFVGDSNGLAAGVSVSGDATIANTGAIAITDNAVTTTKILDDAITTGKILNANVTGAKIESDVALSGSPTTTTQTQGDNSTKVSTTAYVDAAIAAVPGAAQLSSAEIFLGNSSDATAQVIVSGDITLDNTGVSAIKSDVALSGSPTTTTQTQGNDSTKIATTAYVDTKIVTSVGLTPPASVADGGTARDGHIWQNKSNGIGYVYWESQGVWVSMSRN